MANLNDFKKVIAERLANEKKKISNLRFFGHVGIVTSIADGIVTIRV